MHRVVVVAVPPVTSFDLFIPETILSNAVIDGCSPYQITMCTAEPGLLSMCTAGPGPLTSIGSVRVKVDQGLRAVAAADTVIVTGTGARDDIDPRVLTALRRAAARGTRIASICSGAFALAEAGLLDGRPATTHWAHSDDFRRRYPLVDLQPDVLYVDDGSILTSAGAAAGIDLCIHIIRRDLGAKVANATARLAVVAPIRPGGQAQFVQAPIAADGNDSLAHTRAWALRHLADPLTLDDLAARARVSVRTLTRRFRTEAGCSPLQWLLHQRIERARDLLESTTLSMDQVAGRCGLGTADSLRKHMLRQVGVSPTAYRVAFSRLGRETAT